jgi:K+-sensing histidine kinase KdpD
MRIVKEAISTTVSLAVVGAVTAILLYAKLGGIGPLHPVFFYLLPVALVAILYGGRQAMVCAAAAITIAAYFLYDPMYSFHVASGLEFGDLICFAGLAVMAIKCTGALLRPGAKISAPKSRYGQP